MNLKQTISIVIAKETETLMTLRKRYRVQKLTSPSGTIR